MKILKLLFVLGGFMFFASCGGDDCTQADWVGTYTLDADSADAACDSTLVTTLTIAADSTNALTINGTSVTLDNCDAGNYKLDGTSIELSDGDCKATYKK